MNILINMKNEFKKIIIDESETIIFSWIIIHLIANSVILNLFPS